MAIVYQRGKPLSYTGVDRVVNVAGKAASVGGRVLRTVASLPMRYVDAAIEVDKRVRAADAEKTRKLIERNFGSVENYERINSLMR